MVTHFIDLTQHMAHSIPGFWRRLICLIYESFILLAVVFIASLIFHLIFRDTQASYFKPLFQLYLLIIMGYYFTWFWTHGGQTLAMQTWKMRLVSRDGKALTRQQAIARFLYAFLGIIIFVLIDQMLPFNFVSHSHLVLMSTLIFGSGFIWAVFDHDHQFLHDRLAGTRIIKLDN